MRGAGIAASILLTAVLASCYSSDAPLLTDANSVTPYAKISFRDVGTLGAENGTMIRDGKSYTMTDKDGSQLTVRFMATDRPDWFVAQMSGPPKGFGLDLLYAVVKVDVAKHQAQSFRAFAADPKVATPGHHICKDMICIDDIRAYLTQALAYADKGGTPDVIYEISVE
jgi:hypothetical protein